MDSRYHSDKSLMFIISQMKFLYKALFVAAGVFSLATGFIGCTKNEPEVVGDGLLPVPFICDIPIEGIPLTRASRMDNLNVGRYGLYGMAGKNIFAKNVIFERDEDGNWSQTGNISIPSREANYYAVNASFAKKNAGGIMDKLTMTLAKQSFTYTVPERAEDQFDLMYASSIGVDISKNGGDTGLRFKSALAALNFIIVNKMEDDYSVIVGGISVHNMINSGTFTFSTTEWNSGTWTEGTTRGKVERILDEPFVVPTTRDYLVNKDTILIVLPQAKGTKWKTKDTSPVSIAEADADGQTYLKLLCKIQDKRGIYLLGTDNRYGEVYLPINITKTTEGKTNTLTISFSGGYDSSGKLLSFGSGFDIEVDPWTEGTDEPEDMEF